MYDILVKAGCFVCIILLGVILRKVNFFKEEDFMVLSKIVIKITLTAAIVNSFTGRELEYSMLVLTAFGFLFGVLLMLLGFVLYARRGSDMQSFAVLNLSGCNIGNFAMPFAQGFLGPVGVMAVSLFDVGNAFICLGGAFSIAAMVKDKSRGFSFRFLLRSFSKSVPLITYIVMTILAALHISLPQPVTEYASIIGNANAFMAMLMIGVGFHLSGNASQVKDIVGILGIRYALGIALAVGSWFLLPLPLEYRQALVIVLLSPIASAAPAFTAELKGDHGLAAAINSFSILCSIVLITIALLLVVA